MSWSETIEFDQPLREVRFLADAPSQGWEELLRAREEAGYRRGSCDAGKAVSDQMLQQRAEIAALQNGILENLSKAVSQVIQESETAVISLALEAAGRIVAGLPISAELVESVVRETLRQAEDTAEVLIQLHPEDLAILRRQDSKLLADPPDSGPLRFGTSAEVTRGGCIVQTRFGVIDARREVKLEQLSETVRA